MRISLLTAVVILFAGGDAAAENWRAYLSPGPVGRGHQMVAGKCDSCHLVFKGLPNEKCLACHTGIQDRLKAGVGYHAQVQAQSCNACHLDHKGPDHSLTRAAAAQAFDHAATVFPLDGAHAKPKCAKCHDKPLEQMNDDCTSCHQDSHDGALGQDCQGCHSSATWSVGIKTLADHQLRMDGGHTGLDCQNCHQNGSNLSDNVPCASCHEQAHGGTEEPCEGCHSVSGFKPAKFDHKLCPCAFPGKHKTASCLSCHEGFKFTNTPTLCSGCHTTDLPHDPLGECSVCHSPLSWTKNRFNHNRQSRFKLKNQHLEVDCFRCHMQKSNGRTAFKAAPTKCYGCHQAEGATAHGDFGDCAKCHTTGGFKPSTFDHSSTGFALDGQHQDLGCQDCHANKVKGYPKKTAAVGPYPGWPTPVTESLIAMLIAQPSSTPPKAVPVAARSKAAPMVGNDQRSCNHCHEDPHKGTARGNCANCHQTSEWQPSTFGLERHATTKFPLRAAHTETSCTLCHVDGKLSGQPTECAGCHIDVHQGRFGQSCEGCHNEVAFTPAPGFNHSATGFSLTGPHTTVECLKCHGGAASEDLTKRKNPTECQTCHALGHGPELGSDCQRCHLMSDQKFVNAKPNRFDHSKTPFALERRHRVVDCKQCHPAPVDGRASLAPTGRCMTCHIDPHKGSNSNDCALCHEPDRWRLIRFDHDTAGWPLNGRHFVTPCSGCHTNQRWFGLTTDCFDCHALDAARGASIQPDAHPFGRLDCNDCHFSSWTWKTL